MVEKLNLYMMTTCDGACYTVVNYESGKIVCYIYIYIYIRPIKVIFKNETDKINIIKHAIKLKDSEFNKVGITHAFSIDQLIIQSDLIKKAKSNSTDEYKVIFLNNSFKTISIVSESQQYDE